MVDPKYEKDYKTIKGFLNTINESLRNISECGYDTKDLYILYDMVRYDILSDDNIKLLYNNRLLEDYIIKLNTFDGLLRELSNELRENKKTLNEKEKNIKEIESNKPTYEKMDITSNEIKRSIATLLMAITPLTIFSTMGGKVLYDISHAPKVEEYSMDSSGKRDISIRYDKHYKEGLSIIEYRKSKEPGFVLKKEYLLKDANEIKGDTLEELDLSELNPVDFSLIIESEAPEFKGDVFREGYFEIMDENQIGKATNIDTIALCLDAFMYTASVILFTLYGYAVITEVGKDSIGKVHKSLVNLAKYKMALRKHLKELNVEEKEKAKYEKIVNTICSRIDKTIVKCTEELANVEYMRKIQIEKEAALKENKFKEIKREEEQKKQEQTEKVKQLIGALGKEIKVLEGLDDSDCEELYHSIGITENMLFEEADDHLRIRSKFIPLLRFLDLSYIDFSNVDIRYIDFRGTNAIIRPQNIYNKDASYAKFNDNNLPDFSNYKGVNLTGSELDENETTLVNKENAVISDETVFKRRLNK